MSIISPYILDITENKGGLMVFVKSHIPSTDLMILKFHLIYKLYLLK